MKDKLSKSKTDFKFMTIMPNLFSKSLNHVFSVAALRVPSGKSSR